MRDLAFESVHVRILAGGLDRRAGSQIYHADLIRRLVQRGYRVSTVCFGQAQGLPAEAEVHSISRPPHSTRPLLWRLAPVTEWAAVGAALRRSALSRPDVVIAGEHLLIKEHRRLFPNTPWIYLPHALTVDHEFDGYRMPSSLAFFAKATYRHIQRWALEHAHLTLRFTSMGCDALKARYREGRGARYVVNPIGVSLPDETTRNPETNWPLRILSVGQLIHRKGFDIALEALSSLRDLSWTYDIVGDGGLRRELEVLTERLGIQDRVQFHGFSATPGEWYQNADVFLFPSRSESLGLVLLEAMSHGLPSVAFRNDGREFFNVNEEIIEDGSTGYLADDEADLTRVLRIVIGGPVRLREVGERARLTVQAKYSWEAHLRRYDEIFVGLLDQTALRGRD